MECKRFDGCSKEGRCADLGLCFIAALQLKRWLSKQQYTRACTLDNTTCLWCLQANRASCAFREVVADHLELDKAVNANRASLVTHWIDNDTFFTTIIKDERKLRILFRDKNCMHCGTVHNLTIDHIIPRSKGGSNGIENLQALCADCNVKKSDKIIE